MKNLIIGIALIILGILLGLYVGGYLMLVKGIIQIIEEIRSPQAVRASIIAWGIVKIIFAGFIGSISGLFLVIPGKMFIDKVDT